MAHQPKAAGDPRFDSTLSFVTGQTRPDKISDIDNDLMSWVIMNGDLMVDTAGAAGGGGGGGGGALDSPLLSPFGSTAAAAAGSPRLLREGVLGGGGRQFRGSSSGSLGWSSAAAAATKEAAAAEDAAVKEAKSAAAAARPAAGGASARRGKLRKRGSTEGSAAGGGGGKGANGGGGSAAAALPSAKRQRRLEKNREIARNCRKRKRERWDALERDVGLLRARNLQLERQLRGMQAAAQAGERAAADDSITDATHMSKARRAAMAAAVVAASAEAGLPGGARTPGGVGAQAGSALPSREDMRLHDLNCMQEILKSPSPAKRGGGGAAAGGAGSSAAAAAGGGGLAVDSAKSARLVPLIEKYKDTFADFGSERQAAVNYHLDHLKMLLLPNSVTKMCIWSLEAEDEFYNPTTPGSRPGSRNDNEGGEAAAQEGAAGGGGADPAAALVAGSVSGRESSASPPRARDPKDSVWGMLVQELELSEVQQKKLLQGRDSIRAQRRSVAECLKTLGELRGRVARNMNTMSTSMSSIMSIITPAQQARFLLWVEKNQACTTVLNTLWSLLDERQKRAMAEEDARDRKAAAAKALAEARAAEAAEAAKAAGAGSAGGNGPSS